MSRSSLAGARRPQVFVPSVGARLTRALELLNTINFIVAAKAEDKDDDVRAYDFENAQEFARALRHLTSDVTDQITWVDTVDEIRKVPAPDSDDQDEISRGAVVTLRRVVR